MVLVAVARLSVCARDGNGGCFGSTAEVPSSKPPNPQTLTRGPAMDSQPHPGVDPDTCPPRPPGAVKKMRWVVDT